jgi:hypothetical protein
VISPSNEGTHSTESNLRTSLPGADAFGVDRQPVEKLPQAHTLYHLPPRRSSISSPPALLNLLGSLSAQCSLLTAHPGCPSTTAESSSSSLQCGSLTTHSVTGGPISAELLLNQPAHVLYCTFRILHKRQPRTSIST